VIALQCHHCTGARGSGRAVVLSCSNCTVARGQWRRALQLQESMAAAGERLTVKEYR
jgi:hypothetical protein